MTIEKEIKDAMKDKKIVIGKRNVLKNLKTNSLKFIIYANNCPEDIIENLRYYNNHFGIELKKFNGNSRQLGEICGKPFNILVLGVKK